MGRCRALLFSLLLLIPGLAEADQFPRFVVDRFEGWVEDTGTTAGRIVLLPIIVEPAAGWYWEDNPSQGFVSVNPYAAPAPQGLEIAKDGRIKLGYRIVDDLKYVPADIRTRIAGSSGIAIERLNRYQLTFVPNVKYLSVTLHVGDVLVATDDFGGGTLLSGARKGGVFFLEKQWHNQLRAGDFRLTMKSEFPLSEFSSIQAELNSTTVTSSWIKAFREVTKKNRRSGFNAGFIDFSHAVQKVRVEESIQGQTNIVHDSKTDVVIRDPTPDQLARLEAVLGFQRQTQADMLASHASAHTAALSSGSLQLAAAHALYIKDINAGAPGNSDAILAALSKLSDGDAMKFLTSGIKTSMSSAATSYKYSGTSIVNTSTTTRTEYNEYLVKTSTVANLTANAPPADWHGLAAAIDAAYLRIHQVIFGVPGMGAVSMLTPKEWAPAVAAAIQREDLSQVRYAIVEMPDSGKYDYAIDLNYPVDTQRNRLLHKAVAGGNAEIVELLLGNGADPRIKNQFGDSAIDKAHDGSNAAITSVIDKYSGKSGSIEFRIHHQYMQLVGVQLLQPTIGGKASRKAVDAHNSVVTLSDVYPTRGVASFRFVYRFVPPPGSMISIPGARLAPGNAAMAEADGYFEAAFRVRDGDESVQGIELKWQGPAAGFVQETDQPGGFGQP